MLQLAANLSLFNEPSRNLGLACIPLQQNFDREVAPQVDVAAAEHRPHSAARDFARQLVPVADLFRRRHGIGPRLDDQRSLAFGVTQQHRPQRPQHRSQFRQDAARGVGRPAEPYRQPRVQRVGRNQGSIESLVGILGFVHGRFSAFRWVILNQDQARDRFRENSGRIPEKLRKAISEAQPPPAPPRPGCRADERRRPRARRP